MLKGAVYESYIRPTILYGREVRWEFLRRTERSMVRAMCGVQLKDRKGSTDLMFMLGLKETIDQLAMANIVRWYVFRRKDGLVFRWALDFMVAGQRKRMWKKQAVVECMMVGLRRRDTLCRSKCSVDIN